MCDFPGPLGNKKTNEMLAASHVTLSKTRARFQSEVIDAKTSFFYFLSRPPHHSFPTSLPSTPTVHQGLLCLKEVSIKAKPIALWPPEAGKL